MSTTSQNNVADKDHNETYVGIDVSQGTLAVHVLPTNESFTVPNSTEGIKDLVKRFQKIGPKQILLEATGGLQRELLTYLIAAEMAVVVLNPRQAYYLTKGLGQDAKTDHADAKALAKIASLEQFTPRPVPSGETLRMNDFVTRKQQLIDMRAVERNHLHAATQKKLAKKIIASIEKIIDTFDKQIDDIDTEIEAMIAANPEWTEMDKILRSVPGVGPKTAQVIISCVPEIRTGKLTSKQIARLAGLAPMLQQSGKWTGESHIQGGRANVRSALYMASVSAIKKDGVFKALFDRIRAKGKAYKVAMVAVMRKLITVLNAMIKNKTHWNEHSVRS
jgi:transposase